MKLFDYSYLALDFDGVFTNNKVYCDLNGNEFVRCCKYDSMALNIVKKYIKTQKPNFKIFILSSENNNVVTKRATKLGLQVFQGIDNKFKFLEESIFKNESESQFNKLIFLGNDINDLKSMKASSFSACPKDSSQIIKINSDFVGKKCGGDGFIREVLEYLIYPSNLNDIYYDNVII